MMVELPTPLGTVYLRLQADRCTRMSRSCMDLETARDLRRMAEEYSGEALKIEATAALAELRAGRANSL